jgi:hypothetical protein
MHSVNSDRASWSKTPAEASSSPASTHRKEGIAPAESALNSTHAGGRNKKGRKAMETKTSDLA